MPIVKKIIAASGLAPFFKVSNPDDIGITRQQRKGIAVMDFGSMDAIHPS